MGFEKKILVLLFCVLGINNLCALTNGPMQQEYTSFEPADVTDMVNLPTGDFTYVLPIGNVKDPSGAGYPIVLNYHAGILNEQEATWVGLGWNLNVGAINRQVRGYPDDYSNDATVMYLYDEGQNGWNFNIGGGWGPFTCMVGWSEKGFQGVTSVGLNASFGNAIGFNVGWDHDFLSNSDEFSFGVGVGTKNSLSASHSEKITIGASGDISTSNHSSIGLKGNQIAYFSMDTKGTSTFGLGGNAGASLFKKSAKGLNSWGYGGGGGISILGFRFDQNSSFWGWNFSQLNFANSHGYLFNSSNMQHEIRFIGQSVLESVLEKPATGWQYTPYQSSGLYKKRSVTDDWGLFVNYYEAHPNKLEYTENRGFNWPSQDQYYVSSQGINGAFKPFSYRPLKTCYSMEAKDDAIIGKTNDTQYPYTFEYYFNDEQTKISPMFRDGITFKMLGEQALSLIDSTPDELDYSTVRDYKNINSVENNSTGTVAGTRITPLFGIDPYFPDKLNGFVVTDQEGKTYYYTMPLYSLCQFSYTMGVDAVPTSSATELSYRADMGGYAITWLLTAITGPDYVKMVKSEDEGITERLLPHNGDWGYWVTFRYEYGKQVVDNGSGGLSIDQNSTNEEKSAYVWRDPYTGNKISKCETPARYSSTLGIRDITYLKSIETASEVAYFKTSERLDGVGAVDNYTTLPFLLPVDNAGSSGLVDYKTNNYNRLSCWIKKNSVGVIKNKDEIGNDYRNCTKIVLERSRYNIDHIYNEWLAAPEGTPIANYYLKADVEVEGGRIVPQTGNLKIIKNITGFNVNTRQVGDIELGGSHPVETKDIYNFGNLESML
jgi:hypothetical protein